MGSVLSSESITVDQLRALLEDLKANDAKVTIHISAFHYQHYTETTIVNEEIPLEEGPLNGREGSPEESRLQWVNSSEGRHPEEAVNAGTDPRSSDICGSRKTPGLSCSWQTSHWSEGCLCAMGRG